MSESRWPVWKLAILLYPFAAAAVAINLFLVFLMAPVIGIAPLTPYASIIGGLVLGIPATWASGRWVRHMMDEADS
ncbi:MAG: hypothetical protein AB3N20_04445 [Rhizobiaceae bacterium]